MMFRTLRSGRLTRVGALLLAAAGLPAAASTFSIAPIRVELNGTRRTEALTVRNDGDAPVIVHVRAVAWAQQNGEDQYVDTRDVIATPAVFGIGASSEQVLRVALRRDVEPTRELSYRLFLQEVPPPASDEIPSLKVALRLSLPIFVAPAAAVAPQLEWAFQWIDARSLRLNVSNRGDTHVQLHHVRVGFGEGQPEIEAGAAKYVLPGSEASWIVAPPSGLRPPATIHVHGGSDSGDFAADAVAITRAD